MVCDVARGMGYDGFNFISPHEIFREHAQLTAHRATTADAASIIGAWGKHHGHGVQGTGSPPAWPMAGVAPSRQGPAFSPMAGSCTPTAGRASMPLTPRLPENAPDRADYPLVLQHRTRARSLAHHDPHRGKSANLSAHIAEPFVEVNPADALAFAVRAGELARVRSRWGTMVAARASEGEVPAGVVFAPIHWNRAFASDARVGALTKPRGRSDFGGARSSNTRPWPSSRSRPIGMA